MKFLIYSNSPQAQTGYGVQVAHLAARLKGDGHDVAVACTWGHQIGVKDWPTEHGPVRLYWQGVLENSVDIFEAHADHWFDSDRKSGWVILVNDVWAFNTPMIDWQSFNVLAWCPVDHWPVPYAVTKFFHNSGALPVAMSRFGERTLSEAALDPLYAPLAISADFKPTWAVNDVDSRTLNRIPQDAFAVLMVAMNKDPADRKNFNAAFRAFGRFWREHQEAVLVVHTDPTGMFGSGIDLYELAKHCAIPPHALIFTSAYAQRHGLPTEMLASLYTACDVLIAPSKGEGFGVPMIEAQACGTPVIASDFTSQTELVGPGWLVSGQLEWDSHQRASYLDVFHQDLYDKLEQAYASDAESISQQCQDFARQYLEGEVFNEFWRPIIAGITPREVIADKPMMESVDVIVPLLREENEVRFRSSFDATAPDTARLIVCDEPTSTRTFAENVIAGYEHSTADWILIVGDDVEFTPGWFEAAQKLSDRYDVIGTNDSEPGRVRNPAVANGSHADHWFMRYSYVEEIGGSLDGPGLPVPTCFSHWWVDKEVVELAKARGVFGFAEDCRILHHHPGYDGDEDAREADPLYMRAVDAAEDDRRTWMARVPLIQALRVQR